MEVFKKNVYKLEFVWKYFLHGVVKEMKNNFWRKIKYFFKRNAYTLAVCLCVALAVTMIAITAVTYAGEDQTTLPVISVIEDTKPVDGGGVVVFSLPVKDGKVLKEYAEDHLLEDKTTGDWKTHQAIDFEGAEGTIVLAVYDGTVEKVEESMMDGLCITIDHGSNLKTVYKCLASEASVKQGDKVKKGQEIGKISTNLTEKADGPHLHFELYSEGNLADPTGYFSEMGK